MLISKWAKKLMNVKDDSHYSRFRKYVGFWILLLVTHQKTHKQKCPQ